MPAYLAGQLLGAFAGVAVAHAMFAEPLFSPSRHARTGVAQAFSEFIATFGLLAVIWGCARVVAQLLGAGSATALFRWLVPTLPEIAPAVLVPHSQGGSLAAGEVASKLGDRG